jgi:hypothetical protein
MNINKEAGPNKRIVTTNFFIRPALPNGFVIFRIQLLSRLH